MIDYCPHRYGESQADRRYCSLCTREERDALAAEVLALRASADALAAQVAQAAQERDEARVEVERLRSIEPELPPRPPVGDGLPRYGLRWNEPTQPLAVPMDDGYWTPWHLAVQAVREMREAAAQIFDREAKQWGDRAGRVIPEMHAAAIRALPLPGDET